MRKVAVALVFAIVLTLGFGKFETPSSQSELLMNCRKAIQEIGVEPNHERLEQVGEELYYYYGMESRVLVAGDTDQQLHYSYAENALK